MANTDGIKTPIDPGIIARLTTGVRYALTGKAPPDWFGPGTPLPAVAQEAAVGRAFDFPVLTNTTLRPRHTESVTFDQMRTLADGYDLLRLVIETRKDQLAALEWVVKPKAKGVKTDARCDAITAFLQTPDGVHDWTAWLRMVVEDMLVIDAATLYPRLTNGGQLYALEPVDGGTIKRILDATGRTPAPPDPAYQQILKGLPAVDYTTAELIYAPRNPRTNRVYGYSPVEQIIMSVNIAIRRQLHQLQHYTEGNIPEAFIGVPEDWNPDQIRMFQEYWDSILEGNTAQRRHAKFVPGGMDVHETRPNGLKDEFDDWLARVVCFAFGIEPTPFIKGANRATAQTARQQSLAEGLLPHMKWVKVMMDRIIATYFGAKDLHFHWSQDDSVDALTQAQIDQIYVTAKVKTADEVRDALGLEPLTDDQKAELSPPPPPQLVAAPAPNTAPPPTPNENPASQAANEVKHTEKAAQPHTVNHYITVQPPNVTIQPPDVLVDIGATTITAHLDGKTERATIERLAG